MNEAALLDDLAARQLYRTDTRNKKRRLGTVLSMFIRHNNFVVSFIVRFRFTDAKRYSARFSVGNKAITTTIHNFSDSLHKIINMNHETHFCNNANLVKFECRRWVSLDPDSNVAVCICRNNISWNSLPSSELGQTFNCRIILLNIDNGWWSRWSDGLKRCRRFVDAFPNVSKACPTIGAWPPFLLIKLSVLFSGCISNQDQLDMQSNYQAHAITSSTRASSIYYIYIFIKLAPHKSVDDASI